MGTLTMLHISDLHFGPPYVPKVGEALLRVATTLEPDAVIVSGDLTQRAKPSQFADAKAWLDSLPSVPRLIVPGNHDIPLYRLGERIFDPHRQFRRYISDELNPLLLLDGAVIVGIDSTAPRQAISNGRIHPWQLDRCSKIFAEAPADAARIVVAHHHFAPAPDYLHDQTMPKAKRAMTRFIDLGVELILGGHLHRAYIGDSLDFFPGNRRQWGIIIAQSGTTTSRRGRGRERQRNSFNVIRISATMISITHYMYFEQAEAFAPLSRHQFSRNGKPLRRI